MAGPATRDLLALLALSAHLDHLDCLAPLEKLAHLEMQEKGVKEDRLGPQE